MGLWFGGEFIDGVGDFYDNYKKMKRGNITGSDKYYHCMANCQASKRGAGGKLAALDIGIARELTDIPRNIVEKGLTPKEAYEDLIEDSQANWQGFTCPKTVPCHDRCKALAPASSLPFILKNRQP
jgi:hypothetical protein